MFSLFMVLMKTNRKMSILTQHVIGGIQLNPAIRPAPDGYPGVRLISTDQAGAALGRMRAQITADIPCRHPQGAQAGQREFGLIPDNDHNRHHHPAAHRHDQLCRFAFLYFGQHSAVRYD